MARITLPMNTVREYIDQHASERSNSVFLVTPESSGELTYGELARRTADIAAKFDELGIAPGSKVAYLMNNGCWTTLLFLGVMASGRVVVPLNAVAGPMHLAHVLGHSDSEVVFVAPQYREILDKLLQGIERDVLVIEVDEEHGPAWPTATDAGTTSSFTPTSSDPALLLYTSGSTGLPKGAILSHLAVTSGGRNVVGGHGLTNADRALCVLPVYHINGAMVTLMAPLASGGSVVMPSRFSASAFWPLVAEWRCTWASVVPTIIKYLLDRASEEPFDFGNDERLASFRFARSASAPLAAVVLEQWEEAFKVPMIETIGLTETAATVATNPMPPAPRKPGSVGLAYGNEIRIVDENGDTCEPGTVGEVMIRGDNLLTSYYKNEEATQGAFVNGWFRTGDLAQCDKQGYIYISGRLKELIIRGGENIAPREIDDVLYRHVAILEAAAVGIDDEAYGQEVIACVALRDGYTCTEEELKTFCVDAVGPYKAPKRIFFLDELPKGPSGKIQRLKLPELLAERLSAANDG
jgi:acyl-CoA synthetase (AMP-forming)/AMP-acid ligase II